MIDLKEVNIVLKDILDHDDVYYDDRTNYACKQIINYFLKKGYLYEYSPNEVKTSYQEVLDKVIDPEYVEIVFPNNLLDSPLDKHFNSQPFFIGKKGVKLGVTYFEKLIDYLIKNTTLQNKQNIEEKKEFEKYIDNLLNIIEYSVPSFVLIDFDRIDDLQNVNMSKDLKYVKSMIDSIINLLIKFGYYEESVKYYKYYSSKKKLRLNNYLEKLKYNINFENKFDNCSLSILYSILDEIHKNARKSGLDENRQFIFCINKGNIWIQKVDELYGIIKDINLSRDDILDWNKKGLKIDILYYEYFFEFKESANFINDAKRFLKTKKLDDIDSKLLYELKTKSDRIASIMYSISDVISIIARFIWVMTPENKEKIEMFYTKITDFYNENLSKYNPFDDIIQLIDESELCDMIRNELNEEISKKFMEKIKHKFDLKIGSEQEYCKRFFDFTSSYNNTKPLSETEIDQDVPKYTIVVHPFKHNSNDYFEFIKNNNKIVNSIAFCEKIIENADFLEFSGGYTGLVVEQIKDVERLLKEILVQKYPNEIYLSSKGEFENKPIKFKSNINISDLTAESLSGMASREIMDRNGTITYKDINMELGGVAYAMTHALMLNSNHDYCTDKNYNGIFFAKRSLSINSFKYKQSIFYEYFISKTRNGYFHIEQIENYEDAVYVSRMTSYWMCRIIDEMLTIDPNFRLR